MFYPGEPNVSTGILRTERGGRVSFRAVRGWEGVRSVCAATRSWKTLPGREVTNV